MKKSKNTRKSKTEKKFTTEIENLLKLLEASYIDEGLPAEPADKFSTKETITTMVTNCNHGRLKTILEANNFSTMIEVVTVVLKQQEIQVQFCVTEKNNLTKIISSEVIIWILRYRI